MDNTNYTDFLRPKYRTETDTKARNKKIANKEQAVNRNKVEEIRLTQAEKALAKQLFWEELQ